MTAAASGHSLKTSECFSSYGLFLLREDARGRAGFAGAWFQHACVVLSPFWEKITDRAESLTHSRP